MRIWLSALASIAVAFSAGAASALKPVRITEDKPACELDFSYPTTGVKAIDADIATWAQSLLTDFRASCAEAAKEPGTLGPAGKYSGELSYEVVRDDANVVSVTFNFYSYTGGAHPNTQQYGQTYLKSDGHRVYIAELIGSSGLKALSAYAIRDLKTQWGKDSMSDEDWLKNGAGPAAPNFEAYAWKPNGDLLILFSPYQVAAYAAGPQEVTVPASVVKTWLRPDPRTALPSFECAKATTAIETAICKDWRLARADRQMAEDYAEALSSGFEQAEKQKIVAAQRAWIKSRDQACGSVAAKAIAGCLMPLIEDRRKQLNAPRR